MSLTLTLRFLIVSYIIRHVFNFNFKFNRNRINIFLDAGPPFRFHLIGFSTARLWLWVCLFARDANNRMTVSASQKGQSMNGHIAV
jgi:hypothetical protein